MFHWLAYMLDITMSILFFIPFYNKLLRFSSFRIDIYAYGVLPASLITLAGIGVMAAEFALFLLFAAGLLDGWKELAAILLLAVFAFSSWRKTKLTGVDACSCYGEIGFLNRSPVIRNLVLIVLLLPGLFLRSDARDLYTMFNSLIFVMAASFAIEILQSVWGKRKGREKREQSANAV